jgi:hypothetical protein
VDHKFEAETIIDTKDFRIEDNPAFLFITPPLLVAVECCHWRHSRCTIILPPGAIQSCHLIRSGLDCQIQLSEAAWRLRSEQQAVRCGLPVNHPEASANT